MRFEFHPEALAEFKQAAQYYADCQAGLELRFIGCVESTLQRIGDSPQHWRIFEQELRRCLVYVFPFTILYSIESDHVLIVAVMHCSREPGYWRHRVQPGA